MANDILRKLKRMRDQRVDDEVTFKIQDRKTRAENDIKPELGSVQRPARANAKARGSPEPKIAKTKVGPINNGPKSLSGDLLKCDFCDKTAKRMYDLKQHMKTHTGEKPYKCGICGSGFSQVGGLKVHMRSHSGEKPFVCNDCNKGFATKERLKIHVRIHTGEKPFSCDQCGKRFAAAAMLTVHQRIHSGVKAYSCPSCDLKFGSSGNLKTHMKLHLADREFQCHLCDKSYPRADTLKRHILSFHENKRLYKCDICGKSFKGHIRDHMRTHVGDTDEKPYGCHQCGARFNQRSQLTVHMRVHTGERPYSCKICKRAFSHSTALKLHLRMHTGERPHVCKLCQKSFSQLPHLKKHMLCVHNTDRPYYCEVCETFFKIKNEYQDHAALNHPDQIPSDLVGINVNSTENIEVVSIELISAEEADLEGATRTSGQIMPMEKLRTLLALLLKKISTPKRLKKLGFGTKLIDDVLRESIAASGRTPAIISPTITERDALTENISILLDWTIPKEYMKRFKEENKKVETILEELAS